MSSVPSIERLAEGDGVTLIAEVSGTASSRVLHALAPPHTSGRAALSSMTAVSSMKPFAAFDLRAKQSADAPDTCVSGVG
jgi:hypothetical protein